MTPEKQLVIGSILLLIGFYLFIETPYIYVTVALVILGIVLMCKAGQKFKKEDRVYHGWEVAVIAVIAILAIGWTVASVNAQTTTNMTQYKDPQNRFSVLYPLWWNSTGQPDRFSTTLLNSGDGYGTDMILGQLSTVQDPQTFALLATSNFHYINNCGLAF